MAWIESHQSLGRHRKTLDAVAVLKTDRHKFIGHLHELWWWGLDNADTDGVVGKVPSEALAAAAGWPLRDARRFVDALLAAGFLDLTNSDEYVLHDWFDYAGKLNAQRELRKAANRISQRRRRERLSSSGQHDVSMTGADGHGDIDDSQQPTGPTVPDQPPVGPLSTTPGPARAPHAAGGRGARPKPLRAQQEQCPLCPEVFPNTAALRVHLDESPRHKVRPTPETFGRRRRSKPVPDDETPPDVKAELEAMASRPPSNPSPQMLAEHERYLARERQIAPDNGTS